MHVAPPPQRLYEALWNYKLVLIFHGTPSVHGMEDYHFLTECVKKNLARKFPVHHERISVSALFLEHSELVFNTSMLESHTIYVPVFLTHGYHVSDIASHDFPIDAVLTASIGENKHVYAELFAQEYTCYCPERSSLPPVVLAVAGSAAPRVWYEYEQLRALLEHTIEAAVVIWCANNKRFYSDMKWDEKLDQKPTQADLDSKIIELSSASLCCTYLLTHGLFYQRAQQLGYPCSKPLAYQPQLWQQIEHQYIDALTHCCA